MDFKEIASLVKETKSFIPQNGKQLVEAYNWDFFPRKSYNDPHYISPQQCFAAICRYTDSSLTKRTIKYYTYPAMIELTSFNIFCLFNLRTELWYEHVWRNEKRYYKTAEGPTFNKQVLHIPLELIHQL